MDWDKASDAERQQEAERRIAEARRDSSRRLDLGDLGLSRLPESLAELVDLEELALGWWGFGEDGQPEQFDRPNATFHSLAPLAQIKGLRQLHLGPCAATSLEPVFGLSQLRSFLIESCPGFSGELATLARLGQLQSLAIESCAGFSGKLASLAELGQLQSLAIESCPGFSGELASLAGLVQLQNLAILDCAGFSGELASLAGLCQLQSLTIAGCDGFSGELASLARLSQLRQLTIADCAGFSGELASLAGLCQLQSLTIAACVGFLGELASLAGLCKLQSLTIEECDGFSGALVSLAGLSNLQSLELNFCAGFSGELASLAGLSKLESLKIQSCDGFLGALVSLVGLSQLQNLELNFCAGFSGELASLAALSRLQSLEVGNCSGLDGEVPQIPTLKTLWVRGCPRWTFTPATLRWYVHKKPALKKLICQNVAGIPTEILSNSWHDNCLARVQSYLRELDAGTAKEAEVKLILLGNGRVGKPSFADACATTPMSRIPSPLTACNFAGKSSSFQDPPAPTSSTLIGGISAGRTFTTLPIPSSCAAAPYSWCFGLPTSKKPRNSKRTASPCATSRWFIGWTTSGPWPAEKAR